jgi:DivIVA domain-containing protein
MFWFQLVVAVALLAAVGWLAVGGGGHMSEPVQDRPDLALPPDTLLARTDVDRVRFSVGARGYRMDEVDDVLDRLAVEIELRERRIAELEGHPVVDPDPVVVVPDPVADPDLVADTDQVANIDPAAENELPAAGETAAELGAAADPDGSSEE